MIDSFDEIMNDKNERRAITLSLLFLGGGFLAIWFLRNVLEINADSVTIAMLLLPLIVYLIVSGRISELKTPGGLEAKFKDIASEELSAASETVEPDDAQVIMKTITVVSEPDDSVPIIMALKIGQGKNHYSRVKLLRAMEKYSRYRNFKFLVLLDEKEKFVAYMMAWAAKNVLSKTGLGNEFVKYVNTGDITALRAYPDVSTKTINTKTSNLDALKEMTRLNIEAMIVIDEKKKLEGVVEREQLLSKLMLALTQ